MTATRPLTLDHGGEVVELDPLGAVHLPAHRCLVVADLHLEKGSAYARLGTFLPPYDTARTLRRLDWAIQRYRPRLVVSLGDAFHDTAGPGALDPEARRTLEALARGRSWLWVRGNHDPHPPAGLAGETIDAADLGRLHLTHVPPTAPAGRIILAGHLHPKARLAQARPRSRQCATRPCFAGNPDLLLLPAFGAYTGGLNVLDPAIAGHFARGFSAFLLGDERVFQVAHRHLTPDPPDWRRHRIA
ncbi:MAG: ligase-associated DNA damage response endonuclease PdeM [Geminicoccaceae bacterium]|jgi:DNA ligase-associated metallophosphoesterase|nr:ligase-associated DNA damage response endonuclease PdeM [Geminicoccaceae bacterium]MCB9969810.1 ligase-associated DNA damage response endonuclease PdeM [Geminicoccaceae bacterium]HRY27409.1 ligase-associated DNA damage response endonuclease PdeM [Geminicoccaceae bacterium]